MMKRLLPFYICFALIALLITGCSKSPPVDKLHWFDTSAILYQGSKNVYFDPIGLSGSLPPADIILVTHAHDDHWSPENLKKIIQPDTLLVVSPNVAMAYEKAKDELGISATILGEGESFETKGIKIEAVPAFDNKYHLRENGGAGYIITIDGIRIYHAGGTQPYPEMTQNQADLAIVSVYKSDELKEIVRLIPAKTFVFVHTGFSGAKAYTKVLTEEIGGDKVFVALEPGPLEP
jgi:L-ascorbate metabolism protein UlaG (beta-lactamase superfamily)